MISPGTMTRLGLRLQAGDEQAFALLYSAYAEKLLQIVQSRLPRDIRRRVDADDILQVALLSFHRVIREGQIAWTNRQDIWGLLCTIAIRKALNEIVYHSRQRRDWRRQMSDIHSSDSSPSLLSAISKEPNAEDAAVFCEQLNALLNALSTSELRDIALMKLDAMTNREIAVTLKCTERRVERKLQRIRSELSPMLEAI